MTLDPREVVRYWFAPRRPRRSRGPAPQTHCRCGYDLAGLPRPGVCPECGEDLPPPHPNLPSPSDLAALRRSTWIVFAGLALSWAVMLGVLVVFSPAGDPGLAPDLGPQLALLIVGPLVACWGWRGVLHAIAPGAGVYRRITSAYAGVLNIAIILPAGALLITIPQLPAARVGAFYAAWIILWSMTFFRDAAAAGSLMSVARELDDAFGLFGAFAAQGLSWIAGAGLMLLATLFALEWLLFSSPAASRPFPLNLDLLIHALWTISTLLLLAPAWLATRD